MNIKNISIKWKTICDESLNFDSVTSWKDDILVSSKDKHKIYGYNKETGELKYMFGDEGFD